MPAMQRVTTLAVSRSAARSNYSSETGRSRNRGRLCLYPFSKEERAGLGLPRIKQAASHLLYDGRSGCPSTSDSGARGTQPSGRNPAIATSVGFFPRQRLLQDQPAPLAMTWNTNPSNVIPTATATIGSRTSAVAFTPLTGPVQVSNSPTAQSRKLT